MMASFDVRGISEEEAGRTLKILPDYTTTPQALLLVEWEQGQDLVWIGHVDDGFPTYPQIIVQKSTNDRSKGESAFLGLRILLRCQSTLSNGARLSDYLDNAIVINSKASFLSHRKATDSDKNRLTQAAPTRQLGFLFSTQELHQIELSPTLEETFFCKPPEAPLKTSNPYVTKAYKALQSINKAKTVWIFLPENKTLVQRLNWIIKNKDHPLAHVNWFTFWKYPLPYWMSNKQTQMAAGMADLVNKIYYQSKLVDGTSTSLACRPLARAFANFIAHSYPKLGEHRKERETRVLPAFLNVTDSTCEKNEDGTPQNTANVSFGIGVIKRILANPEIGKNVHIGVVAMHSGQAEAYKNSLSAMQPQDLQKTNSKVIVIPKHMLSERKAMDFVILDVSRVGDVGGSVENIIESAKLREALTIHRDGFIVIGRLPATLDRSSRFKVVDENKDKFWHVCQWFSDHNRVADVPSKPFLNGPSLPARIKTECSSTRGKGLAITSNVSLTKRKADTQDIAENGFRLPESVFIFSNTHGHSEGETRSKKISKVSHTNDEADRFLQSLHPGIQPPPASPTPPGADTPLVESAINLRAAADVQMKPAGLPSIKTECPLPLARTNASAADDNSAGSVQFTAHQGTALSLLIGEVLTRTIKAKHLYSTAHIQTTLENSSSVAKAQPAQLQLAQVPQVEPLPMHDQSVQATLRILPQPDVEGRLAEAAPRLSLPPHCQGQPAPAIHISTPPQLAQEQPDTALRPAYTVRYRALRAMFAVLHQNLDAPPVEDQLLSMLDETYLERNERSFEIIYDSLLHICRLGRN